jgi:hypothetical protein
MQFKEQTKVDLSPSWEVYDKSSQALSFREEAEEETKESPRMLSCSWLQGSGDF